jgi:hypothetical protein
LEKTYGTEFLTFIKSKIQPERLLVWDTKGPLGRPDVNVELERVYKQWNAQGAFLLSKPFKTKTNQTIDLLSFSLVALFIGSPALNKSVLRTSRARGIPVFVSLAWSFLVAEIPLSNLLWDETHTNQNNLWRHLIFIFTGFHLGRLIAISSLDTFFFENLRNHPSL